MFVRHVLQSWIDLIAPPCCPGCDVWLEQPSGFCDACRPLLEQPSSGSLPPASLGSAFVYGGPLADAICKFKYKARTDLSSSLGALLANTVAPYLGLVDMVVPIPLFPRRLRRRGFNQSALLASPVAKALGVPMLVSVLIRVRDTLPQVELDLSRRASNMKNAFAATLVEPAGRILLVDDVTTTGATFLEASKALCEAGAEKVYCLALAKADLV